MSILDDLPSYEARPAEAARVRRATSRSWSRATFIRATVATAMGVGLSTLGIFPAARVARASHGGTDPYFKIKQLPCPGYAAGHNCLPGCGDSEPDPNGCQTSTSSHYYGWHRGGCNAAWGNKWRYRPDDCVSGTTFDGWQWDFGDAICGCYSYVIYRCHDGFRCDSNCANCVKTICRWVVGGTRIC